jgi:acetoin utilization deacetylase AcuC-like enzyme
MFVQPQFRCEGGCGRFYGSAMHVVATDLHRLHNPNAEMELGGFHPPHESVERAETIKGALLADSRFVFREPSEWGTGPIEAVHDPGLVRFLSNAWAEFQAASGPSREVIPDVFYKPLLREGMSPGREPISIHGRLGWWCFETTTPLVEGTYLAARGSVDTAMTATRIVMNGERAAYGLCRPPGHHAPTANYGGYCFFNNAAVAANYVATTTGTKVAILDVDYHHGNGIQEIFYNRDDVLYVSLHGDPARAYPYSVGFADETGGGRGLGYNLNLPLAARTGDDEYLKALDRACEAIAAFGPSMVIVSLGLDTFDGDPIADLAVTTDGFERCGARVRELGLPTVVLQEGGYNVGALGENARRWLIGVGGLV